MDSPDQSFHVNSRLDSPMLLDECFKRKIGYKRDALLGLVNDMADRVRVQSYLKEYEKPYLFEILRLKQKEESLSRTLDGLSFVSEFQYQEQKQKENEDDDNNSICSIESASNMYSMLNRIDHIKNEAMNTLCMCAKDEGCPILSRDQCASNSKESLMETDNINDDDNEENLCLNCDPMQSALDRHELYIHLAQSMSNIQNWIIQCECSLSNNQSFEGYSFPKDSVFLQSLLEERRQQMKLMETVSRLMNTVDSLRHSLGSKNGAADDGTMEIQRMREERERVMEIEHSERMRKLVDEMNEIKEASHVLALSNREKDHRIDQSVQEITDLKERLVRAKEDQSKYHQLMDEKSLLEKERKDNKKQNVELQKQATDYQNRILQLEGILVDKEKQKDEYEKSIDQLRIKIATAESECQAKQRIVDEMTVELVRLRCPKEEMDHCSNLVSEETNRIQKMEDNTEKGKQMIKEFLHSMDSFLSSCHDHEPSSESNDFSFHTVVSRRGKRKPKGIEETSTIVPCCILCNESFSSILQRNNTEVCVRIEYLFDQWR